MSINGNTAPLLTGHEGWHAWWGRRVMVLQASDGAVIRELLLPRAEDLSGVCHTGGQLRAVDYGCGAVHELTLPSHDSVP